MALKMKYFVLNPHKNDPSGNASQGAMRMYAQLIEKTDPALAGSLNKWASQAADGLVQDQESRMARNNHWMNEERYKKLLSLAKEPQLPFDEEFEYDGFEAAYNDGIECGRSQAARQLVKILAPLHEDID